MSAELALPQSRTPAVKKKKWNECRTSSPAVPHTRSGKKWILNECRTSDPALPHSRSGLFACLWRRLKNEEYTSSLADSLWPAR